MKIVKAILLSILFLLIKVPLILSTDFDVLEIESKVVPNGFSEGVQFDQKTAFVTQRGSGERFFITRNGGKNWVELVVKSGGNTIGPYGNVKILMWCNGTSFLSHLNTTYCNEKSDNWHQCAVTSINLRGQLGFRVILDKENNKHLQKTTDGGAIWTQISNNIWFDCIQSFDMVSPKIFYALVVVEDAKKGNEHRLIKSADAGASWQEICDTENLPSLEVWATHLFFINEKLGWVASDRDDGLFMTLDGGFSWKSIKIPERVVSAIFFRTEKKGRVIGGVKGIIYETVDGGQTWQVVTPEKVVLPAFNDFFTSYPLAKWNDFAVKRTLFTRSRKGGSH